MSQGIRVSSIKHLLSVVALEKTEASAKVEAETKDTRIEHRASNLQGISTSKKHCPLKSLSITYSDVSIAGLNNLKPLSNLTNLKVSSFKRGGAILNLSTLTPLEDLYMSPSKQYVLTALFLIGASCGFGAVPVTVEVEVEVVEVNKIWDKAPHNAFTDLVRWNDGFYCAFREGRGHVSTNGKIRILESKEAKHCSSTA